MPGQGYQLGLVRTKADGVNDADPSGATLESAILHLPQYREMDNRPVATVGFRAMLIFTHH